MSTPLSPQKDAFASPGSSAWDNLQLSLSEESKSAINKLALLAQTPPPLPTKLLILYFLRTAFEKKRLWISRPTSTSSSRPAPLLPSALQSSLEDDLMADTKTSKKRVDEETLQSAQQFHAWFAKFEHGEQDDVHHYYPDLLDELQPYLAASNELVAAIDDSLAILDSLEEKQLRVSKITDELNKSCERLVIEEKHMNQVAESLRKNLSFFEELDSLSRKFASAALSVQDPTFLTVMNKVDECIVFMTENAELYLLKFKQLRNKGFTLIRNFIVNTMKETSQSMLAEAKPNPVNPNPAASPAAPDPKALPSSGSGNGLAPNISTVATVAPAIAEPSSAIESQIFTIDEISRYYLKLKGQVTKVKPLLEYIESKMDLREYQTLFDDVIYVYFEQRRLVLLPLVAPKFSSLLLLPPAPSTVALPAPIPIVMKSDGKKSELNGAVGLAGLKMVSLTELEFDLFHHFFTKENNGLRMLLETVFVTVIDSVRSRVLSLESLDELISLNDTLKTEILQRELKIRGRSVDSLKPLILRLVEDIQERLLFVTSLVIRDDIDYYIPKDSDLNYPANLSQPSPSTPSTPSRSVHTSVDLTSSEGVSSAVATPSKAPEVSAVATPIKALADFTTATRTGGYFPTLNRTLGLLSKIYLSVENDAFDSIALNATNSCIASLKKAAIQITAKNGFIDGKLFLLAHLLVLEKKLRAFDINFVSTETSLDFSSIISAVRALLTGQKSLFALSRDNALYNVIASSAPRVKTIQIDYKKEMETLLQQSIDDVVEKIATELLTDIQTFTIQASAILHQAGPAYSIQAPTSVKLKDMPFAQPANVAALIARFEASLRAAVPKHLEKLRAFIVNAADQQRVFKPLKTKITDAVSRLKQILNREYSTSELALQQFALLDSTGLARFLDTALFEKVPVESTK